MVPECAAECIEHIWHGFYTYHWYDYLYKAKTPNYFHNGEWTLFLGEQHEPRAKSSSGEKGDYDDTILFEKQALRQS